MFVRKKTIKNLKEDILRLKRREYESRIVKEKLAVRILQLECKHNFIFNRYSIDGILGNKYVYHKCSICGKETFKFWDNIAKKGQQALKLLNLVPKDWKVKGDK